jgi:chloride channel protein, CIC family
VRARRVFNRIPLRESQKVYILTLLIGGICGLAAVSFHLILDVFQDHLIYGAAEVTPWWRWPLVVLVPAAGGLIAGAGLYFLAPEATGSGIPQVKVAYYLGGGRIPARVIPARLFLSSFNIGTGASLGREGPTVQLCAALASLLGRIFAISRKRLKSLLPVGAAAGLAAAFNTPIAAVTFTLEEILGDSSVRPLGSIVIAAVIAAVIERSILGENALFNVPPYRLNNAWELVFYAALGAVAAVAAAAFNTGLLRLRKWFRTQNHIPVWATPAAGGLAVGVIGAIAILLTGSSSIFGIGYSQLASELRESLPLKAAIILGTFKLIASVVSYGSGSTGGIFGPSLYIGGMIGGAVGQIAAAVLPHSTQPGAFALVGMGAVFAGIVRAPVTSIIIIFEMTNNYSIILPLMIANITSYVLASKLAPEPIYEALLVQDDIHLPQAHKHVLRSLRVSSAMVRDVVTVDADLTVAEAFKHVQQLPRYHHAYPVLDRNGKLVGLLTFNDLKRALAGKKAGVTLKQLLTAQSLMTTYPDETLDDVILRLGRHGISQMPVVARTDSSRLLGIIAMNDIAQALGSAAESEQAT